MKLKFEYPYPTYTNRDPDVWDNITMFNLAFPTTLHYFKNHDTGFEEYLFVVLGFGIRLTRAEGCKYETR
jgi:hypothetical protein